MTSMSDEPWRDEAVDGPDESHLITEDDTPVESVFAEKQMRLLTESLNAGWKPPDGSPFFVASNVGVFAVAKNPALVPDVFLAIGVRWPRPITGPRRMNSYFMWEIGKPPDVVIEIISREPNGELSEKLRAYERICVRHYVVFDPWRAASKEELSIFALDDIGLSLRERLVFSQAQLSLTVWTGTYEGMEARWLRWCTLAGELIPTGAERAASHTRELEAQDAKLEAQDAKLEAMAAKLRALGIDPDAD